MQFTKIASAAALLALSASAFATTPAAQIAISSGASASKGNLKVALNSLCTTAGGTLAEYVSGSNISTYVCASGSFSATPTDAEYAAATPVNFSGTAFAEVRLNVSGGSFTAACMLAGWPTGTQCPAADAYRDPATLTDVLPPAGSVAIGGLMDLEATGFLGTVRSGIATPATLDAGFAQAFGVAVSDALYAKMFDDQKASGKLHSSCVVTDTAIPACVPVIGKAQMAAIMNTSVTNEAAVKGALFLAPSQFSANTPMTYARRVNTSGTQAIAQEYFLGNICSPAVYNVVAGGATKGKISVQNLSSTGNVRTTLNTAGIYAIGVMSLENNQTGQSWKWLRVGGMHGADNAAPGTSGVTNTVTAKDGTYDMVYNSRVAVPTPTVASANTFWGKVKTAMTSAGFASTVGLYGASESKFTRGTSNSCLPFGQ